MSEQRHDLDLYAKEAYFEELTNLANKAEAGERIALMSMGFDPRQPHIATLLQGLGEAATRGAAVTLLVDAYDFIFDERQLLPTGPIVLHRDAFHAKDEYHLEKLNVLETLKLKGGSYEIINYPRKRLSNPFGGRSHIKTAIVGDTVFIGGCNMDEIQVDLMTRLTDKPLADWLYSHVQHVRDKKRVLDALHNRDQRFEVDANTIIFIDAGVRNQSIIFDELMSMIDGAENWLMLTCQFYPQGILADRLSAAHQRGVKVNVIYNHPSRHIPLLRLPHALSLIYERLHQPPELFTGQLPKDHTRLHAKVIATEKGAMIGSHNYVEAGVKFGTAEIALQRHDSAFAEQAVGYVKGQLQYHPPQTADLCI